MRSGDGLDPMTKVNVAQVPQKGPRGSMFWEDIVKIGNDVEGNMSVCEGQVLGGRSDYLFPGCSRFPVTPFIRFGRTADIGVHWDWDDSYALATPWHVLS